MTEYQKLIMSARYSPTTVGNMVMDKNGEYCSSEAFEIIQAENSALKEQVAQLSAQVADLQSGNQHLSNALADTEALELGTCERLAKTRSMLTAEQSKVKVLTDALELVVKRFIGWHTAAVEALATVKEVK